MLPAVVLRQHRTRLAGLGRQGTPAKLAANDGETGDGHGETAGPGAAHRPSIMPDTGPRITAGRWRRPARGALFGRLGGGQQDIPEDAALAAGPRPVRHARLEHAG